MCNRAPVGRVLDKNCTTDTSQMLKPSVSVEALEGLASTALAAGGRREGLRYVEWDISGSCLAPVRVNRYSNATQWVRHRGKYHIGMEVTLLTKCRRCDDCARKRAAHWRYRAIEECLAAPRTWFGTLTLRPDEHYRIDALSRVGQRNAKGSGWLVKPCRDWQDLTDEGRSAVRMQHVGREVTLWLKRVRKNSGVPFRYLLATEIHTGKRVPKDDDFARHVMTGYPHVHVLIHEVAGAEPLRKKFLTGRYNEQLGRWEYPPSWTLGFTKFTLLDESDPKKGAMYLCKYLSESIEARVRASIDYGNVSIRENVLTRSKPGEAQRETSWTSTQPHL